MRTPKLLLLLAAAAVAVACTTPLPAPRPPPPAPVVKAQPAPPAPVAPVAAAPQSPFTNETEWKRAAAQHIQKVNASRVFQGRPPYPLKAVVVVEMTVGADGQIQRASVLRAPDHARDLGAEAVRTAQAASPVPPPPRALAANGSVRTTETWLFRHDNLFQLRSLALEQIIK